jgi:glycine/D-amino acid oxidase-like deaminating enzyme
MAEIRPEGSKPFWLSDVVLPPKNPLNGNVDAHTCVIGAGIAGLTTAYLLAREGLDVVVLEESEIGGGQTSRTTAHLTTAHDDRYAWLEGVHGRDGARLAAESHAGAIDQIEQIVNVEQIACDFQRLDGYLFLQPGKDGSEAELHEEFEAARRARVSGVEWLARAPLTFNTGPCIHFPSQGQFHPMEYLIGLAKAVERYGGDIYTGTHAAQIRGGAPAEVETSGGQVVRAQHVVVATNTPIHVRVGVHAKQAAYRTYVIAARVARNSVPKALYWDTGFPYHYVRLQPIRGREGDAAADMLIVGGEDHKTGQPDEERPEPHAALEQWARERFPMMGSIEYRWSGQVIESFDGLAYIGSTSKNERNIYLATGDSGMGTTHGTMAGMILCDLINGRENPWADLYDPSRVALRAAGEYARETVNFVGQYADWVTPGEVAS